MISNRAEAVAELDAALAALKAAQTAQGYSMGELSVSRASLSELRAQVSYWQRVVAQFDARSAGATNPGAAFASFR